MEFSLPRDLGMKWDLIFIQYSPIFLNIFPKNTLLWWRVFDLVKNTLVWRLSSSNLA
jgi:hypothetical protein